MYNKNRNWKLKTSFCFWRGVTAVRRNLISGRSLASNWRHFDASSTNFVASSFAYCPSRDESINNNAFFPLIRSKAWITEQTYSQLSYLWDIAYLTSCNITMHTNNFKEFWKNGNIHGLGEYACRLKDREGQYRNCRSHSLRLSCLQMLLGITSPLIILSTISGKSVATWHNTWNLR
jgi:hypothetical protein